MSVRRLDPEQPASFAFTADNLAWAKAEIAKYPQGKQASAVLALLWRAQEQHGGWLPEPALRHVADMLAMAPVRVLEIATFYTMFQLSPVGRCAHIQVCGTTPCMLRGSGDLIEVCRRRIAGEPHQLSADGEFSWEEVECVGACVNAPLIQVGRNLFEDLTPESLEEVLDGLARGECPAPGPRIERQLSAPVGGPTTLTTPGLYAGQYELQSGGSDSAQGSGVDDGDAVLAAQLRRDLEAASASVRAVGAAVHGEAGAAAEADSATAAAETGVTQSTVAESAAALAADLASSVKVTAGDADGAGDGPAAAPGDAAKPAALAAPREGRADDLKRISGIGPKLEGVLNGLGVFHFDQIAAWAPDTVLWVDNFLSFKGRIERENWIEQAEQLAGGGATAFSKRVDKGEVQSSRED